MTTLDTGSKVLIIGAVGTVAIGALWLMTRGPPEEISVEPEAYVPPPPKAPKAPLESIPEEPVDVFEDLGPKGGSHPKVGDAMCGGMLCSNRKGQYERIMKVDGAPSQLNLDTNTNAIAPHVGSDIYLDLPGDLGHRKYNVYSSLVRNSGTYTAIQTIDRLEHHIPDRHLGRSARDRGWFTSVPMTR